MAKTKKDKVNKSAFAKGFAAANPANLGEAAADKLVAAADKLVRLFTGTK